MIKMQSPTGSVILFHIRTFKLVQANAALGNPIRLCGLPANAQRLVFWLPVLRVMELAVAFGLG
jgi:hypothetical protein